jgi:hypothetical protein
MSNISIESPVVDNPSSLERRIGLGTFLAGASLTVAAIVGPGALLGYEVAASDQTKAVESLAQDTATIHAKTSKIQSDQNALDSFPSGVTSTCAEVVQSFLPGGTNQAVDTTTADLSLKLSEVCPPDLNFVADGRSIVDAITVDQSELNAAKSSLLEHDQTIGNPYRRVEGAASGAVGELALLSFAVAVVQAEKKQYEYASVVAGKYFVKKMKSVSLQKTRNFWRKTFGRDFEA